MDPIKPTERFPLEQILKFYLKNSTRLYVNYFKEFKLISEFLGPFSIPENIKIIDIPSILVSYELQELSAILHVHPSILFQIIQGIEK